VDAAHIHQFADSRNNHPRNGIALCKNAHWMFDEGLWSLDDEYRVLVAVKRFDESGADTFLLSRKANNRILLPADPNYWPDKAHLGWHRKVLSLPSTDRQSLKRAGWNEGLLPPLQ
jgi:putative restriction endonuclease